MLSEDGDKVKFAKDYCKGFMNAVESGCTDFSALSSVVMADQSAPILMTRTVKGMCDSE